MDLQAVRSLISSAIWMHCRPPAVISQDEKDAEKAPLRAVDARPIKKVAEAKARKRKRMQVWSHLF